MEVNFDSGAKSPFEKNQNIVHWNFCTGINFNNGVFKAWRGLKIKKIAYFTAILLPFVFLSNFLFFVSTLNARPDISAKGAALMEVESGRILFSKNSDEELKMASTTKVMTALLALEKEPLDIKVKASEKASQVEGSSIYLKEGEELKLEDMLYGLMLESGNDSAHAIAEHVSRNLDSFNNLMNKRARELGAANTNFNNPHGLPAEKHYTTAEDLLKISAYALKNPVFERIVSTKSKVIPGPGEEMELRFLNNTNKFLDRYKGADGVKTGWTEKAGRCLVFSASRDGINLAGVLLDAPQMYEDAEKLLDWAFSKYRQKSLVEKNQVIGKLSLLDNDDKKIEVCTAKEVKLLLSDTEEKKVNYIVKPKRDLKTPVNRGEIVAHLEMNIERDVVGKVPLKSTDEIKKDGLWDIVSKFIQGIF